VDNTYQYCIKTCDNQLIPLQRSTTVK